MDIKNTTLYKNFMDKKRKNYDNIKLLADRLELCINLADVEALVGDYNAYSLQEDGSSLTFKMGDGTSVYLDITTMTLMAGNSECLRGVARGLAPLRLRKWCHEVAMGRRVRWR